MTAMMVETPVNLFTTAEMGLSRLILLDKSIDFNNVPMEKLLNAIAAVLVGLRDERAFIVTQECMADLSVRHLNWFCAPFGYKSVAVQTLADGRGLLTLIP